MNFRSERTPHKLAGYRRGDPPATLVDREWIVANGIGGYASGTLAGICSRRYHGLLVASLAAPLGRTVMLNHLQATFASDGGVVHRLAGDEVEGQGPDLPDAALLEEFVLEDGLPVWRYGRPGFRLEKRIVMPHRQNTTLVRYRLVEADGPLTLALRPSLQCRSHEARVSLPRPRPYRFTHCEEGWEVEAPGYPVLRLHLVGGDARLVEIARESGFRTFHYRMEAARGYDAEGWVWSPGSFETRIEPGEEATFVASAEPWATALALTPAEAELAEHERRRRLVSRVPARLASHPLGPSLVVAADQFVIRPLGRPRDAARSYAFGDDARTVIAGYHWFTDWGRDTMISLEGLTLATGRHHEAGSILRTFAGYVRDGLIPNMFPDGQNEGLYHTADATLWFFHAVDRYLAATADRDTLELLMPTLVDILERHVEGTRFGIGVDPADGLLRQGAPGYQLTWMDAKVDDWVVTPRRGKAVEINALFYNALRLVQRWTSEARGDAAARKYRDLADRVQASFNRRFWNDATGCLLDVVDGEPSESGEPPGATRDDPAIRPNMLLAVAMPHAVLDPRRWASVVDIAREKLLTPFGLRSLAPGDPDYKPRYDGDLRTRDAAYHQGTVWGWLIGPYVDAYVKVYPEDRAHLRAVLAGFEAHLADACVGSMSEIFDAEPPFTPRGCIAQAWSVAELVRCLLKVV
jgi:predicted glycogen debranching enzyme